MTEVSDNDRHWSVSAVERPPIAPGILGYVDSPAPGLALRGWMAVEGWCFSTDGSPVTISVQMNSVVRGELKGGLPRNDVVEAFAANAIDRQISMPSGFSSDIALTFLEGIDDGAILEVIARTGLTTTTLAVLHVVRGTGSTIEETSQAGETEVLRRLMPTHIPTLVVDVGAHDGRFLSNSYPFIAQGWRGLLVEPLPAVFERLVANHLRHPNATCVNVACGAESGVAPLFIGTDGELGQNSTLSTDDTEWMRNHRTSNSIDVKVEPISKVLDQHGIGGDIGLLLVDCEGMDLEALQGLDPTRHRPWIVVTEQYAQNPTKEAAKAELLRSWGMTFRSAVGYNDIWVDPAVVSP